MSAFWSEVFFQPHGGHSHGGDRFDLVDSEPDRLWFYLGDATGHGHQGALFWERYETSFQNYWKQLIQKEPSSNSFAQFVSEINVTLTAEKTPFAQLCLTFGVFMRNGEVFFSTSGYGTHLLASRLQHTLIAPETSFGMKLGWLSSSQRARIPNAFIFRHYSEIDRVILMSDSFLGEDHHDPQATLTLISQMHQQSQIQEIPREQVIPYFLKHFSSENDDTTLVVIERLH